MGVALLSEYLAQFAVAQFAYPALTRGYGHVGKVTLVLNHLVDALLEGVLGDEPVYHNILMLADTIGTVGGLSLDSWVPPQVVVDDVAGSSQVQASASGFQREQEYLVCAAVMLEPFHHLLTLFDTAPAMQEERSLTYTLFYHLLEHVAHLAELGKDKYLLSTLHNGFQQRKQHLRLA